MYEIYGISSVLEFITFLRITGYRCHSPLSLDNTSTGLKRREVTHGRQERTSGPRKPPLTTTFRVGNAASRPCTLCPLNHHPSLRRPGESHCFVLSFPRTSVHSGSDGTPPLPQTLPHSTYPSHSPASPLSSLSWTSSSSHGSPAEPEMA